jgi:Sec-independent protein translocase protein TatA
MSFIFDLIKIIRALIGLYEEFRRFKEAQKKAEEEKRRQELDKALGDAEKATTPDEAFDAQDRVVDNSN